MTIDFSLSPELEEIRLQIRNFINTEVKPVEEIIENEKLDETDRDQYISHLIGMRKKAFTEGLWLPHMPKDWGGMGLGHVELAMVQAEAAKSHYGPWVLNCLSLIHI